MPKRKAKYSVNKNYPYVLRREDMINDSDFFRPNPRIKPHRGAGNEGGNFLFKTKSATKNYIDKRYGSPRHYPSWLIDED